jgi:hypothetical protein
MGAATRTGAGTQVVRRSPSLRLCVGVPCKWDPTGMGPPHLFTLPHARAKGLHEWGCPQPEDVT